MSLDEKPEKAGASLSMADPPFALTGRAPPGAAPGSDTCSDHVRAEDSSVPGFGSLDAHAGAGLEQDGRPGRQEEHAEGRDRDHRWTRDRVGERPRDEDRKEAGGADDRGEHPEDAPPGPARHFLDQGLLADNRGPAEAGAGVKSGTTALRNTRQRARGPPASAHQ